MKKHIITLPGDGIGPEIMKSAEALLKAVGEKFNHEFTAEAKYIGGAAIDYNIMIRSRQKQSQHVKQLMLFYSVLSAVQNGQTVKYVRNRDC